MEKCERKWGKEITSEACVERSPSAAKCLFTSSNHQRHAGRNDLLASWTGRNNPNTRHSLLTMYCTYRGVESTFSSSVSAMKRLFQQRGEKTARGTDVSVILSLSISPEDAAQTPLGRTETSGKNCQRD